MTTTFEDRVRLEVQLRRMGVRRAGDIFKTDAELEAEVRGEFLADAELRGRARALARAPAASAPVVPAAPAAAPPKPHKTRGGRADPLAAVLTLAGKQALDATDWQSVWAALVALAQPATRPAPLLGYVEREGVKYQKDNADGGVDFLSREAFSKRFKRKG